MTITVSHHNLEAFLKLLSVSNNYDVYKKRLLVDPSRNFDYVPRWVYFYYIKFDGNGYLDIQHYLYSEPNGASVPQPIDSRESNLIAISQNLATFARTGNNPGSGTIVRTGSNFQNVVWTKKSYVIFFVDQPGWSFHGDDVAVPGIIFSAATPNHSFYDAMSLTVPMLSAGGVNEVRSAISLVNHMKQDDYGNDLSGDPTPPYNPARRQPFEFSMALDVEFTDSTAAPMMVTFDPSGTNQGPPENP